MDGVAAAYGLRVQAGKDDDDDQVGCARGFAPVKDFRACAVGQVEIEEEQNGERVFFAIGVCTVASEVGGGIGKAADVLDGIEEASAAEHDSEEFSVVVAIVDDEDGLVWRAL